MHPKKNQGAHWGGKLCISWLALSSGSFWYSSRIFYWGKLGWMDNNKMLSPSPSSSLGSQWCGQTTVSSSCLIHGSPRPNLKKNFSISWWSCFKGLKFGWRWSWHTAYKLIQLDHIAKHKITQLDTTVVNFNCF
jgi:hypothetical protein